MAFSRNKTYDINNDFSSCNFSDFQTVYQKKQKQKGMSLYQDKFKPDSNHKISHGIMSGSPNLPIIVLQQPLVFKCLQKKWQTAQSLK